MEKTGLKTESIEPLKYSLTICIVRHGAKQGEDGPLSEAGAAFAKTYFRDSHENLTFGASGIHIETSPKSRAIQTSNIFENAHRMRNVKIGPFPGGGELGGGDVHKMQTGEISSYREDERLSEGGVATHEDILNGLIGQYGNGWVRGWLAMKERPLPDVKTGREAVAGFTEWLLEKIIDAQKNIGDTDLFSFSHGPVMLAFLIKLEEKTHLKILPENWDTGDKSIFHKALCYLAEMYISHNSKNPDTASLFFEGKSFDFPLSVLQEIIDENR